MPPRASTKSPTTKVAQAPCSCYFLRTNGKGADTIRVITSRSALLWVAAGAACATLAIAGAPPALADSSGLVCSNGQVMDGTCVTPTGQDTSADALEVPQGMANDLSTGSGPGDFDPSGPPASNTCPSAGANRQQTARVTTVTDG